MHLGVPNTTRGERKTTDLQLVCGNDTQLPSLTIQLEEASPEVNKTTYRIVLKADTRIELERALIRFYHQIAQQIYED